MHCGAPMKIFFRFFTFVFLGIFAVAGMAYAQAAYVTGAINWPGGKAQFFLSDGSYVRYDVAADRADAGYPRPITDTTWPGMGRYGRDILVAFNGPDPNKVYFFLTNGTYLRYDIRNDRVDSGYPQPVTDKSWPGLGRYAHQFYAALNWPGGKVQFFLSNGTYVRYDLAADRVDPGYPQRVTDVTWPGLAPYATRITSAINWRNGKAYFFLDNGTYLRYDIEEDEVDEGYPKRIDAGNWPGLYNYFRRR